MPFCILRINLQNILEFYLGFVIIFISQICFTPLEVLGLAFLLTTTGRQYAYSQGSD